MIFNDLTVYGITKDKGRVNVIVAVEQSYSLVSSLKTTCDHIPYTAYGIAYHGPDGTQMRIDDVSCDASVVSKMVEMFNVCQLSPDRLREAILALLP